MHKMRIGTKAKYFAFGLDHIISKQPLHWLMISLVCT